MAGVVSRMFSASLDAKRIEASDPPSHVAFEALRKARNIVVWALRSMRVIDVQDMLDGPRHILR